MIFNSGDFGNYGNFGNLPSVVVAALLRCASMVMASPHTEKVLFLLYFGVKSNRLFSQPDNYAEKPNRALIAECLSHNKVEAWQEFVRRFQPLISCVIRQVVRNYDDHSSGLVEQLTQDTFMKLCDEDCKRLRKVTLADDESLCRYLRVVARNVARDHFRADDAGKRGRSLYGGDLEVAERHQAAIFEKGLSATEKKLLLKEIDKFLRKITKGPSAERDRLIFWMHYRQGLTASEIALVPSVNLSDKGVESLLFRLLNSLRNELVAKGTLKLSAKA